MSIRAVDRASSGLQLASRRLAASAHNSANALTDGFRRVDVTGAEAAAGGVTPRVTTAPADAPSADPVADVVDRKTTAVLYRANLAVAKAADEMTGQVVDLVG
jgi:flagellar basal body rod protein FlgC